jgi:hypothetical protein
MTNETRVIMIHVLANYITDFLIASPIKMEEQDFKFACEVVASAAFRTDEKLEGVRVEQMAKDIGLPY